MHFCSSKLIFLGLSNKTTALCFSYAHTRTISQVRASEYRLLCVFNSIHKHLPGYYDRPQDIPIENAVWCCAVIAFQFVGVFRCIRIVRGETWTLNIKLPKITCTHRVKRTVKERSEILQFCEKERCKASAKWSNCVFCGINNSSSSFLWITFCRSTAAGYSTSISKV